MRKKQMLLVIILCLVIRISFAQHNFLQSKQAYLGQTLPGEQPVIFAKSMLLDSGIVLGKVQFSRDGKRFYYSFARHWFDHNGSGTKEIRFDKGKWQKPIVIASELTNPAFSPDESILYVGGKSGGLFKLDRTVAGWSSPKLWMQNDQYGIYNFQVATSGTCYLGSNGRNGSKKNWSTYDFSTMHVTQADTLIESLGLPLNTSGFDGDFYIAPDESYIIISAKETKDFECELWISFRKPDKTWTIPLSLGDKINAGLAHRFGQYVSPDGKYLFFTKGTSEKDCNIYWVKIDNTIAKLCRLAGVK
ncbi:hypothetical protein QNI16_38455 [Cytophagaceae bacterium YF14B1]|uniref:Uncharacterized protein n=1 Tax=Xanthocytophaga flava TaxID=3048013 RepID=A0AAE3UDA9_9BACT|nr:hypothetical protein [Xanthocytophaga flavus]MDJ1486423.1 hypothetical protein [Xanthocytophaga flavus]